MNYEKYRSYTFSAYLNVLYKFTIRKIYKCICRLREKNDELALEHTEFEAGGKISLEPEI